MATQGYSVTTTQWWCSFCFVFSITRLSENIYLGTLSYIRLWQLGALENKKKTIIGDLLILTLSSQEKQDDR